MNKHEKLKYLFSGWDRVEIQHFDNINCTQVKLLVTDQNLEGKMTRNLRALPLSSRAAEDLLRHKPGQMRFYGRKGDRRFK